MSDTCKQCRFFDWHGTKILPDRPLLHPGFDEPEEDEAEGRCRRFPPIFLGSELPIRGRGFDSDEFGFPVVCEIEWCGEFAPSNAELRGRPLADGPA